MPQAYAGGRWAGFGSGVHAFRVSARNAGRDAALAEIPEDADWRNVCEQLDLDRFPSTSRLERAWAWNQDTEQSVCVGENIGRAYPAEYQRAPWWIGTSDEDAEIVEDGERAVFVSDLKTGWAPQGPAELHRQLRFLALARARFAGVDRAVTMLVTPRDDGKLFYWSANLDGFDLDNIADEHRALSASLARAAERHARGERLNVTEGDHCHYCPAYKSCWAKSSLVESGLRVIEPGVAALVTLAETPEGRAQIGALYEMADEQKKILDKMRAAIKGLAANLPSGVPLPSGKVLREVEVANKTRVIADMVAPTLLALYPRHPEIAAAAVKQEPRATLSTVEEGLRLVAQPGKLAGMKEAARRALREAGALVEGTHLEVRPVTEK